MLHSAAAINAAIEVVPVRHVEQEVVPNPAAHIRQELEGVTPSEWNPVGQELQPSTLTFVMVTLFVYSPAAHTVHPELV
jgi:hypothetical protein